MTLRFFFYLVLKWVSQNFSHFTPRAERGSMMQFPVAPSIHSRNALTAAAARGRVNATRLMVIAVYNCCTSSLLITRISPSLCFFPNHSLMADIRRDQRQTNPSQTSLRHRHQGCSSRSVTGSYISCLYFWGIKIHLCSFLAAHHHHHHSRHNFTSVPREDSAVTVVQ